MSTGGTNNVNNPPPGHDSASGGAAVAEMAAKAAKLYQAQDWNACISVLKMILAIRPDDSKVLHNLALCDFQSSGASDPSPLLKAFDRVSAKQDTPLSRLGGPVVALNRAILLYYSGELYNAEQILRSILAERDGIDEYICIRAAFVLLDLLIRERQPSLAEEVIAFLESSFSYFLSNPISSASPSNEGLNGRYVTSETFLNLFGTYRTLANLLQDKKAEANTPFMQANIEYMRHNCSGALNVMRGAAKDSDIQTSYYFNNVGLVLSLSGKKQAALVNFARSMREMDAFEALTRLSHSGRLPVHVGLLLRRDAVLYHSGVTLLALNKAELALGCFKSAVQHMPNRPMVWIRLADAVIALHQPDSVKMLPVGHDRMVISTRSASDDQLSIAAQALRNAIVICDRALQSKAQGKPRVEAPPGFTKKDKAASVQVMSDSSAVSRMMMGALIRLAYVSLCDGDPVSALDAANEAVSLDPSLLHPHLYAAEALIVLGRLRDASDHLANLDNDEPAAVHTNVAALHLLRGDVEKARQSLALAIQSQADYTPALLTGVWLSLRSRNETVAGELLSRCHK